MKRLLFFQCKRLISSWDIPKCVVSSAVDLGGGGRAAVDLLYSCRVGAIKRNFEAPHVSYTRGLSACLSDSAAATSDREMPSAAAAAAEKYVGLSL